MTGPNLNLNPSMGCFFIGILFSTILYGVTCAQAIYYCWQYRTDKWYIRVLVAYLWSMDTVITIVDIWILWDYIIHSHANPLALATLDTAFIVEYGLSAFTVLAVQVYYLHNAWQLMSKRWIQIPLTVATVILAVMSCACSLTNVFMANADRHLPGIFQVTEIPIALQTVSASIADVFLTATLTLALRKGRTGFRHTEALIHTLSVFVINRGILTTILQFTQFLTYICLPATDLAWALVHFPGCKIYVNSLFAILNARRHWRENIVHAAETGLSVQDIPLDTVDNMGQKSSWFRSRESKRSSASGPKAVIQFTTEVVRDDGRQPADSHAKSQPFS